MRQVCRIVVTTGPDRGKVFEIDEELVHIGRSSENHVVFDDPGMSDHHASLLTRDGRCALYRSGAADVTIDGSEIPVEKWVWLPPNARVQFGRRTACQFSCEETDAPAAAPESTAALSPLQEVESAPSETETGSKKKPEKKAKRKRAVARFITDQGGPLVELGADGHLPELALDDRAENARAQKPREQNPLLLYAALALSLALSMALLLVDPDENSIPAKSKAQARREIETFYGRETEELAAYQRSLRAAHLAHSKRDRKGELREYRKVLNSLNSEDINQHLGVTGHRHTDEQLRKLIGIIISEEAAE